MTKLFIWLERHLEETIACICLTGVATTVFLQVVMRYGFNTALQWSEEVAAMMMVWAVYAGASLCVRKRYHIRIVAGVLVLPTSIARIVIILADLIWAGFLLVMINTSYAYLAVLWKFTATTPSLGINEFYPQSILMIGYVLIFVRLIQIYVIWIREGGVGVPGMRAEEGEEDLGKMNHE